MSAETKRKTGRRLKTVLSNVKQFRRPLSKICSKCGDEPRVTGQRWGRKCFAAYFAARDSHPQQQKARA